MVKISVVIPVYNAEKHIEECVNSILCQTFKDFEIILVDDGSSDASLETCEKLSLKDNRIKVYHKKNGGASSARALGVEYASGEYINFVDSDDSVPESALEELYQRIQEKQLDIVEGVNCFYPSDGSVPRLSLYPQQGEFVREDYLHFLLTGCCYTGPVCTLYRRSLFDANTFDLDDDVKINEDLYMNICLGINARKIGIYNDMIVYYYKENVSSVTHNYPFDTVYPQQHLLEKIKKVLDNAKLFDKLKQEYYAYAVNFLASGCFHNKKFLKSPFVKNVAREGRKCVTSFKTKCLCQMLLHPALYLFFVCTNKMRQYLSRK